ncbi:GNAT family N-acetyltransferase [Zooshikella sp. RANM57]|uniref:GNAT family N-acetyltransferase n=1 Tax=Zooshikella sp. RANM57 TaxID=3425863 RepID=UPI003D6F0CA6
MVTSMDLNGFSKGISLRPATSSDKYFINTLYRSTRDDLRLIDGNEDFVETLIEQQCHAQAVGYGEMFPHAFYFIIEKQQQPIGRVTLDFSNEVVHVVDIAFIPEARNKGYGESVLKALQLAAGKSRSPLILSVHQSNWAAKKLYKKLGFIVEGFYPPYERMAWYPSGKEMTA